MSEGGQKLKDRIQADLLEATRRQDVITRETLRMLRSAIRYAEVERGHQLDEAEIYEVIARQIRQRRESIAEFEKGGREDLAARERSELEVLERYLPAQLTREEIVELARQVIEEVGASGPRDVGKVMGRLMPRVRGRADGRLVNAVVQELLAGESR
jgi:uncharacterized protein YqeY